MSLTQNDGGQNALVGRVRGAWFECSSAAAQSPAFYRAVVLRSLVKRRDRACLVGKGTDLVIDGVQRSANGFVTYTFLGAQQQSARVAHHLHSGAQVVRAVRLHVPVLLLIREPTASALAIVGAWPHVGVGQALRAYSRYYRRVAEVAGDCVVGFFDQVTSDLAGVVQRVNERCGTAFDLPRPTADSARKLYDPDDPSVAERKARAAAAATRLTEPPNRALLHEAEELWDAFQRYR